MNGSPERTVRLFPNKQELDDFMLREWAKVGWSAIRRWGRFTAALSGGRTPVSFYERLARFGVELPWEETHIFPADERCVPADHPDSNFRMIDTTLLRSVPIPPENVHPVRVDLEPAAAAEAYESELRSFFGLKNGDIPRFDLILLGLGEDGHIASLFPGGPGITGAGRLAVAVSRPGPDHTRISLTMAVINAAETVIFLVAGANKASVLKAVVEGPRGNLPGAMVRPYEGRVAFLADREAGALLTPSEDNEARRS